MTTQLQERPVIFSAQEVNAVLAGDKTQQRVIVERNKDTQPLFGSCAWYHLWCDDLSGHKMERVSRVDHQPMQEYVSVGHCPFGKVGDRLWVQEDWRVGAWRETGGVLAIDYKASPEITNTPWVQINDDIDGKKFEAVWIAVTDELDSKGIKTNDDGHYHWPAGQAPLDWHEASTMERWASRLLLEITDIRIERILDISDTDAKAMGLRPDYCDHKYQTCEDIGCIGKWAEPLMNYFIHEKNIENVSSHDWVWVVEFKKVDD